ncbi:MAG: hypothetical protein ACI8P0_001034 [Planctomycetaceae bacterium]|jgi:hypothetical protein
MRNTVNLSRWVLLGVVAFSLMVSGADAQSRSRSKRSANDGPFTTGSSGEIIKFINERIRQNWTDNEVGASPVANDDEWIRRVHLDIVGHIPEADVVESFLKDEDPAKRSKLIDKLLDDDAYIRNFTTVWTNLCIGRRPIRRVSRAGMQKFFREAFARNRPWDEVVYDIISAEGHFEENGAVNFLLAQMTMPDEQVQATAKTTRLFMGIQVQCTQCHNHPFNDWQQSQFWQFNSFFRQTKRINHRKPDPETGRLVDDYSEIVFENFDYPVFYEKRNGLLQMADPAFMGDVVTKAEAVTNETNLRESLAKIAIEGENPLVAQAMVNRTWGQFFGYGFTRPVDDMGPHNAASHPELLERLSSEFVKSNYDLKQLVRWICNSEAYNLTSQYKAGIKGSDDDWKRDAEGLPIDPGNGIDNPSAGEIPLFSHLYMKSMEAEQLYDSLIVATNAHRSGRSSWDQAEQQRQRWLQQFVIAFGTDEGDETTTFNGTIPQALMMMNGELVGNAVNADKGSYLREALGEEGKDTDRIKRLYLATLSRMPNSREISTAKKLMGGSSDPLSAYQDLFWALLNSNEFIFVH